MCCEHNMAQKLSNALRSVKKQEQLTFLPLKCITTSFQVQKQVNGFKIQNFRKIAKYADLKIAKLRWRAIV